MAKKPLFTEEELESLRKADEEIESQFVLSVDDVKRSRQMDKDARFERSGRKSVYDPTYYQANKERIIERQTAYNKANKEKYKAHKAEWYQANKETILAKQRAYYRANKDAIAARSRAYYQAHKEQMKQYSRDYYARKKSCPRCARPRAA